MNLKRYITLGIVSALCIGLVACGDSSDSSSSSSSEVSSSSSENTQPIISKFGVVSDYDYENFITDKNLDENGKWADVTATDFVTLPEDFANITIPTADITPTDEEIDAELENIRKSYSEVVNTTDRKAENGDTAIIDYSGSVDGVVFSGGTAEKQSLTLGSGTFISGFEEQIVGRMPGETFDVVVTFPEGYKDSTDADGNALVLSNKEAVFKVTLHSMQETVLPELTDEWISKNFGEQFNLNSIADAKEYITNNFFIENKDIYILDYLIKNSTFSEIPETLIDYQINQLLSYYNQQAIMYGMDFETFATTLVQLQNVDELLVIQEEAIEHYAKEALVVQAVAEKLELAVDDELMAHYADYLDSNPENYVKNRALATLAIETLRNSANMT